MFKFEIAYEQTQWDPKDVQALREVARGTFQSFPQDSFQCDAIQRRNRGGQMSNNLAIQPQGLGGAELKAPCLWRFAAT